MRNKLFFSFIFVVILVSLASAKVGIKTGIDFNLFGDSRISGQNKNVEILFDASDDITLSYKTGQGDLVVSDSRNSANNFLLKTKVDSLNFYKVVAAPVKNMPVSIGLELGSLTSAALVGTVAAPATASQSVLLAGIHGLLSYESEASNGVKTFFSLALGYRFIDFNEVALAAIFPGNETLKNLSGLTVGVNVGIKF